jgi:myo-inositol-1(or 4)-monophosphatase
MNPEFAAAVTAARQAGALLRAGFAAGSAVRSDAGRDLKLEADVEAERVILAALRGASPHPILSEESGADSGFSTDGRYWVVDPLDGTLNYGRRLPLCCVSIALWERDRPVLGVVHDFLRDECFTGEVGRGTACNDAPVRVSAVARADQAVLATGFPNARDFGDAALLDFVKDAQRFKKLRLLGSAALSLAWVAAGRADAYREDDIWFWDVAAGLALVAAAGGMFTLASGRSRFQNHVLAHNGHLRASRPKTDLSCSAPAS